MRSRAGKEENIAGFDILKNKKAGSRSGSPRDGGSRGSIPLIGSKGQSPQRGIINVAHFAVFCNVRILLFWPVLFCRGYFIRSYFVRGHFDLQPTFIFYFTIVLLIFSHLWQRVANTKCFVLKFEFLSAKTFLFWNSGATFLYARGSRPFCPNR